MKIKKLSAKIQSKLLSSIVITDAVQCVLELVYNSLDAEATAVAVTVDLNKYKIQVIDNGRGIEKCDLELVGQRYMTTKYQEVEENLMVTTYGCKGQALSSMLDVCKKLKIESKTMDGACFLKVFENGEAMPVEEGNSKMNGSGTTVTVFDFLCTMPVRRKRISEVFDIEDIKTQLQYLAVIHHKVAFMLRNENKNLILLQKKSTPTILQSISQIFKDEVTEFLKPISYQDKKFEVSGFVSSKKHTQTLQLLYINKRIITKGVIHKFVNNILKEYFSDEIEEPFSDKVYKKMQKKCNNVFIIEIKCSQSLYEIFINVRKTTVEFKNWKEVLKPVHKAVRRAFKSSDTSSESSVPSNKPVETKQKKKLGVSILNSIVKGAPVKRLLNDTQDFDSRKKRKKTPDSDIALLKPKNKIIGLESVDNGINLMSDSLETPIPRKSLSKITKSRCEKNQMVVSTPSKSFLQFYEWLKVKFERDGAAVNLYNDFLRKKKEKIDESVVYKPPLKRSMKKADEKDVRHITELSFCTSGKQKMIEYNTKTKSSAGVGRTTECKLMSSFLQQNYTSVNEVPWFQQPPVDDFKKSTTNFFSQRVASPGSSESFFKNLINFRNKTESVNCSFIQVQQYQDTNISFTKTWKSHVKNNLKNCVGSDEESVESGKKVQSADAVVQTSFWEVQKADAVVQTSIDTSDKSLQQSFTSDYPNAHQISQEVPYPDFWNLTPEEANLDKREGLEDKPTSSNDFPCGQESNSKSRISSSTSKETRTVAAMMTECLEEIGNVNEDGCSNPVECPGKVVMEFEEKGVGRLSDSEATQLPKTIPVEEIKESVPDSTESVFHLTERHDFVPKGLSPNFFNSEMYRNIGLSPGEQNRIKFAIDGTENDLLASIKWEDESTGGSLKPTIPDGILDEMQLKAERNLIYDENEILSASLTYCAAKVHKLLHSFTFTKELLSSLEILGQLDKKFIVAKIEVSVPKKMTLISLFDQHAVDERIKLEELLNEYLTADGNLISSSTTPHIVCELKESVVQVIPSFLEKLKSFGLLLSVRDEKTVEVKEIPKFLLDRHEKNMKVKNRSSDALTNLLQALITNVVVEAAGSRGTVTKVPNIIHNALCSDACSKAVKFNRSLTAENMEEMINKLKNCKLPFQCAHGRPSVIPVIDLQDFQVSENETLNYNSFKKFLNRKNPTEDI